MLIDLLSLTGLGGYAVDVNNGGEVVGQSPNPDNIWGMRGVIWR